MDTLQYKPLSKSYPSPCRITVKVGTRLLTHHTGKLNLGYMERLVRKLSDLRNEGHEVILVTSGSIGAGRGKLNIARKKITIPEKQAIAAVGQGLLLQIYEKLFSEYGLVVGQILLTRSDLVSRRRYINACNTVITLLKLGVIPIINENDSVSIEEIKFGDNDRLSALVAGLSDSNLLIVLTDVDGLFNANPSKNPDAKLIPFVDKIDKKIKDGAESSNDDLATGGMITKLQAAEIATMSGIPMYITNGSDPDVLSRIISGEHVGTYFNPQEHYLNRRKRWIAYGQIVKGKVSIDSGACDALSREGKSLLPVGVIAVEGSFSSGDLVAVVDLEGNELGRGLSNFSSEELALIQKKPSVEIAGIINRPCSEEVIHRDNLVIY
ncbi:MAG: glutamate 5-kinase [Bacillota bacterium]